MKRFDRATTMALELAEDYPDAYSEIFKETKRKLFIEPFERINVGIPTTFTWKVGERTTVYQKKTELYLYARLTQDIVLA
jgi:hypothetical protein